MSFLLLTIRLLIFLNTLLWVLSSLPLGVARSFFASFLFTGYVPLL